MDTILKKLFDKWFRYKIKSEWSEKIQAYHFEDIDEKRLAKDVSQAVIDGISEVIHKIHEELDMAYWLVDSTIQDTIDQIEEECKEKIEKEQEERDQWSSDLEDTSEFIGKGVICSYEKSDECECIHNKPHLYDHASCGYECAYDDEPHNHAKCEPINDKDQEDQEDQEDPNIKISTETPTELQDVIDTGGI